MTVDWENIDCCNIAVNSFSVESKLNQNQQSQEMILTKFVYSAKRHLVQISKKCIAMCLNL